MSDRADPADDEQPQALAAETVDAFTVDNVNGEVLDSPTVNAFVVGVTISEGGGDPQTAGEG